jgi:hypothetical protein
MDEDGPVDVAEGSDGDDRDRSNGDEGNSTGDVDCCGVDGNHNGEEDHDGEGDIEWWCILGGVSTQDCCGVDGNHNGDEDNDGKGDIAWQSILGGVGDIDSARQSVKSTSASGGDPRRGWDSAGASTSLQGLLTLCCFFFSVTVGVSDAMYRSEKPSQQVTP